MKKKQLRIRYCSSNNFWSRNIRVNKLGANFFLRRVKNHNFFNKIGLLIKSVQKRETARFLLQTTL